MLLEGRVLVDWIASHADVNYFSRNSFISHFPQMMSLTLAHLFTRETKWNFT